MLFFNALMASSAMGDNGKFYNVVRRRILSEKDDIMCA